MGIGVRVIAGLLAIGVPTAAAAVGDFAGNWQTQMTYSDPRCAQMLDNIQRLEIVSVDRSSLVVRLGETAETASLAFDPVTATYRWGLDKGDYSNFIGIRLTRSSRALDLEMTSKEAVFNCTSVAVATRALDSPVPGEDNGSLLFTDGKQNYTLLLAVFFLLVLAVAIATLRRGMKFVAGKGSVRDAEFDFEKCTALATQLEAAENALKSSTEFNAEAFREERVKENRERLRRWESFQDRFYREANLDPYSVLKPDDVPGYMEERFDDDPANFAAVQIQDAKKFLLDVRENEQRIEQYQEEIRLLKEARETLGCEKLEAAVVAAS